MRMDEERESSNVEDRRDDSGGGFGRGGGGGGFRLAGGGGIGVIIFAVVAIFFGVDPSIIFGLLGGGTQQAPMVQHAPAHTAPHAPPAGDAQAKFVSRVLASTEDVWTEIFRQGGKQYAIPKLVLFRGQTPTACGKGQTAMGPFYCPGDQKVYIDLAFYQELQDRFKAPGDFAQAYVIAHEVGHHVQNLMGVSDKVDAQRRRLSDAEFNKISVRMELQADCLAGVWAFHANQKRKILEAGDIEEAMTAATAIGDDKLQKQAQGFAVPESFTHGSSAQRVRWFRRGIDTGNVANCNTFDAREL